MYTHFNRFLIHTHTNIYIYIYFNRFLIYLCVFVYVCVCVYIYIYTLQQILHLFVNSHFYKYGQLNSDVLER